MAASSSNNVVLYLLAIFIPPLAVVLKVGCGADVVINIALWIFGWIPGKSRSVAEASRRIASGTDSHAGVIHAWWIIGKNDPARVQQKIRV